MAITYPASLPDFKMGKQRTQEQTFRTTQPFNGSLYIEKFTDDTPVTWAVTIECRSQAQSLQFQTFLRMVRSGQTFTKKILTEEGFIDHEVRFIEVPLRPQQINSFMWSYSGLIYAAKLIEPSEAVDSELILEWLQDASIIDNAMNNLWGA